MPATASVRLDTLRELVAAGSVRSATLLGQRGGFAVLVRIGMSERLLANRAGQPRLYAKLDTAAKDLRAWGLGEFAVNVAHYEPGRLRAARPDRSAALKAAHEASAHANWLRTKLAAAVADPQPPVSHDQVMADARARLHAPKD